MKELTWSSVADKSDKVIYILFVVIFSTMLLVIGIIASLIELVFFSILFIIVSIIFFKLKNREVSTYTMNEQGIDLNAEKFLWEDFKYYRTDIDMENSDLSGPLFLLMLFLEYYRKYRYSGKTSGDSFLIWIFLKDKATASHKLKPFIEIKMPLNIKSEVMGFIDRKLKINNEKISNLTGLY